MLCGVIVINSFKKTVCISAAVISAAVLLSDPAPAVTAVGSALTLCGRTLIPSLLPFFIINSVLTGCGFAEILSRFFARPLGFIFGISGNAASPVLLGALSGFPIGAKCIFSLFERGSLSKKEAERLLGFCCNAGPAFLVAGAGGLIFGDTSVGWQIYFSQLFAAFTVGILLNVFSKSATENTSPVICKETPEASHFSLSDAISGAVLPMLNVCVFTIFFALLFGYLEPFLPGGIAGCAARGFFELTEGISAAAGIGGAIGTALAAAFAAWSGISVMMQTSSIAPDGISLKLFYIGKLLAAPFAFLYSLLFSFLFAV